MTWATTGMGGGGGGGWLERGLEAGGAGVGPKQLAVLEALARRALTGGGDSNEKEFTHVCTRTGGGGARARLGRGGARACLDSSQVHSHVKPGM